MNKADLDIAEKYQKRTRELQPKAHYARDYFRSFWVGGTICVIGQALNNFGAAVLKISEQEIGTFVSVSLLFITAFLTATGVFDKIGRYAGAGSFVPITGFSNAMVAPAMEFKREGFVLGVGAQMFSITGPVIVYGIVSSIIVGIIYLVIGG